jgi:hypothetical protein
MDGKCQWKHYQYQIMMMDSSIHRHLCTSCSGVPIIDYDRKSADQLNFDDNLFFQLIFFLPDSHVM